MKSYCKCLVIDRKHVARAYELWSKAQAGHKNAWRVPKEHGSASALIDEIAEEVAERRLSFRPIHRYEHREPTNGKVRTIGVESVKQQVVDYAVILAMQPLLDAKLGYWQVAGVPGKGQALPPGEARLPALPAPPHPPSRVPRRELLGMAHVCRH